MAEDRDSECPGPAKSQWSAVIDRYDAGPVELIERIRRRTGLSALGFRSLAIAAAALSAASLLLGGGFVWLAIGGVGACASLPLWLWLWRSALPASEADMRMLEGGDGALGVFGLPERADGAS